MARVDVLLTGVASQQRNNGKITWRHCFGNRGGERTKKSAMQLTKFAGGIFGGTLVFKIGGIQYPFGLRRMM